MNRENEAFDRVRSRRETAQSIGVCLRTLQRMEARGELPPRIRISDRMFGYRDSAINAFLASRTVK